MKTLRIALAVSFLTLCVFFLTSNPVTKGAINSLFVLYIFTATAGLLYWPFARKAVQSPFIQNLYFFAIIAALLLWVGVTGWVFSPFFYFLYLLAIILAFMFSPFVTLMFALTLVGLFMPNVGSIDLTIDLITMIALLSVVPITYFLQREYLQLKQAEKKVLILEEETNEIKNKVDALLVNKIIKMAVNLRQPINDMRQLAMVSLRRSKDKEVKERLHKVIVLGQESLDQIEQFEEKVTGKRLVHTR